jgi:hypothetical protein
MTLSGSFEWSSPVRWPYSWTMIVQKRDQLKVTRELNSMRQFTIRSPGEVVSHDEFA